MEQIRAYQRIAFGGKSLLAAPVEIELRRPIRRSLPGTILFTGTSLEPSGLHTSGKVVPFGTQEMLATLLGRIHPVHLPLSGGEPLTQHREPSRVLPVLSMRGIIRIEK